MAKAKDLTGQKFNKLLVQSRNYSKTWREHHDALWNCLCDCGNTTVASTQQLKSGQKKNCGCEKKPSVYESHIGEKHNKLTIIDFIRPNKFTCQCDCGTIKNQNAASVLSGKAKSCGCLVKEISREIRMNARKTLPRDLTNYRQGRLTIKYKTKEYPNETWFCECDCGKSCEKTLDLLYAGVQSCGCLKSEKSSDRFTVDMTGQKCGMITVLYRDGTIVGEDGNQYAAWMCLCDCGTYKRFKGSDLRSGKVSSCGCLVSVGERDIKKIFNEHNIKYKTQYKFKDLKSKKGRCVRFDFAIMDKNNKLECLIEYQGIQHFEDKGMFGKQQREETDPLKRNYCINHNIPLYEIAYNDNLIEKIIYIIQHTSYVNTVPSLRKIA